MRGLVDAMRGAGPWGLCAAALLLVAIPAGAAEPGWQGEERAEERAEGRAEVGAAEASSDGAEGGEASGSEGAADELAFDSGEGSAEVGAVVDSGGGLFEDSLDGPSTTGAGESSLDLGGYVRSDTFIGVLPGTSQPAIQAAYGELALQARARVGARGDAFGELRLRYGQQLSERALFVDLREAYVNTYLGPLDLRLGKQIVVWGRADAFNPTNNLTPIDFRVRSPVEDDRRVGNVGARAFLNFLPFRLEGVWMPLYLPTTYPDIQLDEMVVFAEPTFPSRRLADGLWATRLHLEAGSFEASASYLYGAAVLPGFALAGYDVGPEAEIRVSRTAYTHHVVGVDFSTAIGDAFGLRGEAAYRMPVRWRETVHAPNPDLQYVIGIDRQIGSINVIAQYLGRYTFEWQERPPPENGDPALLRGQTEPLAPLVREAIETALFQTIANRNQMLFNQLAQIQHSASLRLEWLTLHETLSLSALGLLNVTTQEWLVFPKLSYHLADAMTASVGAEIYSGPDGTLFDMIEESLTAGYAELRLSF